MYLVFVNAYVAAGGRWFLRNVCEKLQANLKTIIALNGYTYTIARESVCTSLCDSLATE